MPQRVKRRRGGGGAREGVSRVSCFESEPCFIEPNTPSDWNCGTVELELRAAGSRPSTVRGRARRECDWAAGTFHLPRTQGALSTAPFGAGLHSQSGRVVSVVNRFPRRLAGLAHSLSPLRALPFLTLHPTIRPPSPNSTTHDYTLAASSRLILGPSPPVPCEFGGPLRAA